PQSVAPLSGSRVEPPSTQPETTTIPRQPLALDMCRAGARHGTLKRALRLPAEASNTACEAQVDRDRAIRILGRITAIAPGLFGGHDLLSHHGLRRQTLAATIATPAALTLHNSFILLQIRFLLILAIKVISF